MQFTQSILFKNWYFGFRKYGWLFLGKDYLLEDNKYRNIEYRVLGS